MTLPLPKSTIVLSGVLAVLVLAAASLTYYQQKRQPVTTEVGQEKNPSNNAQDYSPSPDPSTKLGTSSPLPTPIPLRPDDGVKGTYSVSSKGGGPAISQVIFDPLDVQKGQKLTIFVTVASQPAPAEKVTGSLKTDNGQTELTFTRASTSNTGDI